MSFSGVSFSFRSLFIFIRVGDMGFGVSLVVRKGELFFVWRWFLET